MEMVLNRRKSLYGFEFREEDQRRAPEGERKTYNIKQVWQRTHEILRLALAGHKGTDIAKFLGIHPQTVSNTLNSDLGQMKLSEMRLVRDQRTLDVLEEIDSILLPKALKVYNRILSDEAPESLGKEKLQKETADTLVMDIRGHRAATKVQGEHLHAYTSVKELEEIKRRGIAAAKASGMCIEYSGDEAIDGEVVD